MRSRNLVFWILFFCLVFGGEAKNIIGIVEPPVVDVQVEATNEKTGEVLTGKTDSNGKFSIESVWDSQPYNIELSLQGYKFTPIANVLKFKSTKLSELRVSYFDETTKKPLADVSISMSDEENYQSNTVADENGQNVFVGLPAGKYFVRSVLREYRFEPSSSVVQVEEGETVDLKLYGKRSAFSAFGKVLSAGGVPVDQVIVEAISNNCDNLQEEDVTDENGAFRVRGLKPKCEYTFHVRAQDGKLPAIPPFIKIEIEEKDQEDLVFVVMSTAQSNEIFGIVNCKGIPSCGTLRVELFEDGNFKSHVVLPASERVFFFSNLLSLNKQYRVSISESNLRNLDASSDSFSFVAKDLMQNVVLDVAPKQRRAEIETLRSSLVGVVFVFVSTLIFLNLDLSRDLLFRAIERARSFLSQQNGDGNLAGKRKSRKN